MERNPNVVHPGIKKLQDHYQLYMMQIS